VIVWRRTFGAQQAAQAHVDGACRRHAGAPSPMLT
jgi:hypothetical protein